MSSHALTWLLVLIVVILVSILGVSNVYEEEVSTTAVLQTLPSASGLPACTCYAILSIPNMTSAIQPGDDVAVKYLPPRCPEEYCATSVALGYCDKLDSLPSSKKERRAALDELGAQVLARGTHKEVFLLDDYVIKLPSPKASSLTAYIVDGTWELTTYGALLGAGRAPVLSPVLAVCATAMVQASPVLPLNVLVERLHESTHPLAWLLAASAAVSAASAWSLLLTPPIPVQVCDFRAHSAGINAESLGIEFLDLGWMRPLNARDREVFDNMTCETVADCAHLPHVQSHCPPTCTSQGRCAYSAARAVGSFSREVMRPLLKEVERLRPLSVKLMDPKDLDALGDQLHSLHNNRINFVEVEDDAISIEGAGPTVEHLLRPLYERLRDEYLTPDNMEAMQALLADWLSGWKETQASRCANGNAEPVKHAPGSAGSNRHSVCI
jgi:hypothetical protein